MKNKISKDLQFEKTNQKTTLNTKNQIIKYGLNILYYIFGAKFSRNDRITDFNTKNNLFSILSKNHITSKLFQTNQNSKIYNSKNYNRIIFKHQILKFHNKN